MHCIFPKKVCIAYSPRAQRWSKNVYEKYFGNANLALNMFVMIFESEQCLHGQVWDVSVATWVAPDNCLVGPYRVANCKACAQVSRYHSVVWCALYRTPDNLSSEPQLFSRGLRLWDFVKEGHWTRHLVHHPKILWRKEKMKDTS